MNRVKRTSSRMLLSILMLAMLSLPVLSGIAVKGPRTDDIIISYYPTVGAAFAALRTGAIDLVGGMGWSPALFPTGLLDTGGFLTSAEIAMLSPNEVVAEVAAMNMYLFDINNNYTIPTYPGIPSPTSYLEFRQALAFLTDKAAWSPAGLSAIIDQPIPAPLQGWANSTYWGPGYPYAFSQASAAATLDAAGFVQGSNANPFYDPSNPNSAQFIRTYPPGHPKAGQDLDPLIIVDRTDDTNRLAFSTSFVVVVREHGIPVTVVSGTFAQVYPKVIYDRDYHLYTGAWTTWKFPNVYGLYNSKFTYPGGPNYVTGVNASGLPNYPDLDKLLQEMYYATNFSDAVTACKRAMGLFTEYAINIPLWSDESYAAWNKNLLGVVSMSGYGPINPYTFMNAYKATGGAITVGLVMPPNAMNIINSESYAEYTNLDLMNLYSGFDVPPYDLSMDQPGFVKDWTVTTWVDPDDGQTKTKVIKTFRSDSYFIEPLTGSQMANVNASQYFFSTWYQYAIYEGWHHPKWQDVHHINIVGTYTVEIYFDNQSYWLPYAASGPILPVEAWMTGPLSGHSIETFTEGLDLSTPGFVGLIGDPVWIESVTADGTPLTIFVDYNIIKGELFVYKDLALGTTVEVDYWYADDPSGFTPGNLAWSTIFDGAGPFYATAFIPGVAGSLTLKKNPFYYMETPPLGEIDFVRKPNGCYKIDIFDVVIAAGAYGSSGTFPPSPNWVPGADIAPTGGQIDIFDIVTVAAQYGHEWDCPPP